MAVQAHGLSKHLTDLDRHPRGIFSGLDTVEQHDELIAANACHRVGLTYTAL
ncbi:hypothetical protein D3C76_1884040 [compost metagenome]